MADAGLFTYSAAGTVTASLGGNGVAWGPDAFAVFRNSAQGALADAKVIAGYAVSSWMPGWDLADRHWIHDAGGLFTFGGRQAVLTGVRYLNLPIVELTDEEGIFRAVLLLTPWKWMPDMLMLGEESWRPG